MTFIAFGDSVSTQQQKHHLKIISNEHAVSVSAMVILNAYMHAAYAKRTLARSTKYKQQWRNKNQLKRFYVAHRKNYPNIIFPVYMIF